MAQACKIATACESLCRLRTCRQADSAVIMAIAALTIRHIWHCLGLDRAFTITDAFTWVQNLKHNLVTSGLTHEAAAVTGSCSSSSAVAFLGGLPPAKTLYTRNVSMAKLSANITVLGTAAMPACTRPQKPHASPAVMPACCRHKTYHMFVTCLPVSYMLCWPRRLILPTVR